MIEIKENISLAPFTSFRIGGDAKFYAEVFSVEELKEALEFAKDKKIDFYILGGGTNLLVSDDGFDGLIIKIKMNEISIDGEMIEVQAGVPLIKIVNTTSGQGLSGLEKLAGIPGTVGGAVRGNAGAFSVEIKSCIKTVTAYDTEKMELVSFENEQCNFAYRTSIFKENKNLIVISTTLALQKGDIAEVQKIVTETIMTRSARGLNGTKSAGSYFMNPIVENEKMLSDFEKEKGVPVRNKTLPAGWVIEQAGLLGKQIGGAQVSEKHANYIINAGEATASDVIILVSFVKQQVRDQFGIQLTEEVNYLGF